jgi:hypothetical protein
MRTELIGIRLPLHEATLIRRQAAERGLTKSAHATNLTMRGLEAEASGQLTRTLARLETIAEALSKTSAERSALNGAGQMGRAGALHPELRAFMIEVLVLLRYLTKHDLALGAEISRKLQRSVGEVRVEGT